MSAIKACLLISKSVIAQDHMSTNQMFDYCMCTLQLYTVADKKKSPTSKWFIVKKCFKDAQREIYPWTKMYLRRLLFLFSLFSFVSYEEYKHFCVKSETGMRKEWFWYTYTYLHVQQPFLNMHKATLAKWLIQSPCSFSRIWVSFLVVTVPKRF